MVPVFIFSVQEEFFVFSNNRKATMYFKCMCMLFSFHTNFFEVFFFISKFLMKMKIVKLFPNLNFVVDSETYLLFYSLFKTFVYSLYFHLIHPWKPPSSSPKDLWTHLPYFILSLCPYFYQITQSPVHTVSMYTRVKPSTGSWTTYLCSHP